ncbi:hypothetical protein OsJ_07803 [Oryza sativa Japonica Group]|uniref:VAN3-binding protein-like auxin canalisation domain-containing protein n=1 Tax=Oryza sativa subsp. japonica TaxID=39947 RepID=A3A9T0_ORYSJ|nr:hypothetical protein OsJ_07803 [Oryza sativa Japonica Group]
MRRRDHLLLMDAAPPPAAVAAAVQTLMEPMEFLSRSWSVSASDISRVLTGGVGARRSTNFVVDRLSGMLMPETLALAAASSTNLSPRKRYSRCRSAISAHQHTIGRWFHHRDGSSSSSSSRVDKARAERARVHAAVTVASVAAAVAAVASGAANDPDDLDDAKMDAALASATQLLASHCIEIAELAGADHDQVASAVEAAVDVRSPGDLMTLTASAATALRGATALRLRAQREARSKVAAVAPYEKTGSCRGDIWCKEGTLLKRSRKGALHRKRVAVYINKKSQVIVKLKSKHIGGALLQEEEERRVRRRRRRAGVAGAARVRRRRRASCSGDGVVGEVPVRAEDGAGRGRVPVREQGAEAGLGGVGEESAPAGGRRDGSARALLRISPA